MYSFLVFLFIMLFTVLYYAVYYAVSSVYRAFIVLLSCFLYLNMDHASVNSFSVGK